MLYCNISLGPIKCSLPQKCIMFTLETHENGLKLPPKSTSHAAVYSGAVKLEIIMRCLTVCLGWIFYENISNIRDVMFRRGPRLHPYGRSKQHVSRTGGKKG